MSGWIDLNERSPEPEEDVVLFPDFSGAPIVGFFCSEDCIFVDGDGREVSPTHWMFIGELPV